jgi:hypothetical protein
MRRRIEDINEIIVNFSLRSRFLLRSAIRINSIASLIAKIDYL